MSGEPRGILISISTRICKDIDGNLPGGPGGISFSIFNKGLMMNSTGFLEESLDAYLLNKDLIRKSSGIGQESPEAYFP